MSTVDVRKDKRGKRGKPWVYTGLVIGLFFVAAPFVWLLLNSLKTRDEVAQLPPTWWPHELSVVGFTELFETQNFGRFFFNSVVVAVAVTLGNMVFCSMLGYALAKIEFRGKKVIMGLVMAKLMIPGLMTLVPTFVIVAKMDLVNTYTGLILPFLATPLGVFLMRQFMMGIPDELTDAARIDGAGEWRIFFRIVLPLCKPALATLGILTFLGNWNSFLWPLMSAQDSDHYTLPVALALFQSDHINSDRGLVLAGAVVTVVPILIVFLLLQRHFVRGVAMTGIK
jgi:multiple sugar transport system permease protein